MDINVLGAIARRPFDNPNPTYQNVPATYHGTDLPLTGLVSINSSNERISASLENRDNWRGRSLQALPEGAFVSFGALFRPVAAGRVVRDNERGTIVPEDEAWIAEQATYSGEHLQMDADVFDFSIGRLQLRGPAFGDAIAASRDIYMGAEWSGGGELGGKAFGVFSMSRSAASREEERVGVVWVGEPDEIESEAMWLLVSLVTGNRVHALARERYNDQGALVDIRHHRGTGLSVGREAPFHPFYAPITGDGLGTMGSNIARLLRAGFPVDVVFDHLHMANSGNMDVDAQHYVLAIHCAFEAWGRKLGLSEWIDDDLWDCFIGKARHTLLVPIYSTVGPDVKANLASAVRHANRTTTATRQAGFFRAIGVDIADPDFKRALGTRNEILHNGCFLRRWHSLSADERQQRFSDVQRLRRLTLLAIFRLTGYAGTFLDPITFQGDRVEPHPLPPAVYEA